MSQDGAVSTFTGLLVSKSGARISGAAKESSLLQKALTGSEIHSNSNSMDTGAPV
jgi:hypothetical protein